MIRKNKNKNASSDFGKTDFGSLVLFLFLTFALGLKKINLAELTLIGREKLIEVAYLKIRF